MVGRNKDLTKDQLLELVTRAFRVFDHLDDHETLWWRTGDGYNSENPSEPLKGEYDPFTLLINCNDLFYWGVADCEDLTLENIGLLEETAKEIKEKFKDEEDYYKYENSVPLLWCARWREQRPQVAYYKYFPEKMHPLFDACGLPEDQYCTKEYHKKWGSPLGKLGINV
jgi:hypothetical protein